MSAEILRAAADRLDELAGAATSGPWEFRPRRGFQSVNDNPATIGFVDTAGYFVMLREGTWATEGDMGYVAAMHPEVGKALAAWLRETAISAGSNSAWNAALSLARLILDGSDD